MSPPGRSSIASRRYFASQLMSRGSDIRLAPPISALYGPYLEFPLTSMAVDVMDQGHPFEQAHATLCGGAESAGVEPHIFAAPLMRG